MLKLEKKKFDIEIAETDAREVERLWYQYNGSRDIIKFLMSDKTVDFDVLQEYINVAEDRFTELEMKKAAVAKIYKPEEVDLTKYNFSFDFNEDRIIFEEA